MIVFDNKTFLLSFFLYMPVFKKKNGGFFKKWSPEMAYVLGFFAADGCMIKNNRGAHFIEFQITDYDLLKKIKEALGCDNKLATREKPVGHKTAYRIQVGSKEMFNDLLSLGFTPRKSNNLAFPEIPEKYFSHFVRGYFDGDGNIFLNRRRDRVNRNFILQAGFTSGSTNFLKGLHEQLKLCSGVLGGSLCYTSRAYRLNFSINDSIALYSLMYNNVSGDLFLKRKRDVFKTYLAER